MWYFTWILGVLLACAFGIINVLWLEAQEGLDQHTTVLDPLTKLPNRVEFLQILEQTIEQYKSAPSPFSLLMISLDTTEQFESHDDNETQDDMILAVKHIIEQEIRRQLDSVARYDAKTFCVLLNGAQRPVADATAKRICRASSEQLLPSYSDASVSIGVTEYRLYEKNAHKAMQNLLLLTDQALKQAQQAGINQYFSPHT